MVGNATSKGDRAIGSDIARELFHVDGTRIKIGIISTSFNALSGLQADIKSGDLPGKENPFGKTTPVNILKDLPTTSPFTNDEGRALGQIVHDIAPGAEIFFHTIFEKQGQTLAEVNEESFAKAVSNLTAKGADIIVDDTPVATSFFQDGVAAKVVRQATEKGTILVSAAGNNGNISYETQFRPGRTFALGDITFEAHDFAPKENIDLFQDIKVTKDGTIIRPLLSWDEPIGNVTSEYEMFLLNSPELPNKNNIVSISTLPSSGASDDPLRTLIYQPKKDETFYLLIARRATDSNPPNTLKWISSANGADRTITYEYIDNNSLNDTVYGQANASQSISVGASNPDNPQNVRTYTSKGSSPIVFDTDGNRLSSPVLRNKPEIFAPDGVETTFSSETLFNPFRGSSASAPHVAGVVALMLERAGGNLTSERVRSILQATASPVTQDAGFVRADSAITDSFFSTRKGTKTSNILQGTSFADNLYGKKGSDILKGYQGKDYLVGGSGADLLLGGSENDVLIGGSDSNLLSGGKGNDSFVLEPKGFSIIKDFEIEKDLLAFSGIKDTQNITFLPKANDTLVKYSGDSLAMLVDVEIGDKIRTTFI